MNVAKEQQGSKLIVRLAGAIEESANFDQTIGMPGPGITELILITRDVSRINSDGVKAWIRFFQQITKAGVKLQLLECSPAIVQQINYISNFRSGGTIESILVPFGCTQCKSELIGGFRVSDLKKSGLRLPTVKCSKCGGPAVFDDIPQEYFFFLSRAQ